MSKVTTVGINVAKGAFSAHGIDERGRMVVRWTNRVEGSLRTGGNPSRPLTTPSDAPSGFEHSASAKCDSRDQ
jgi:hypothetical protein